LGEADDGGAGEDAGFFFVELVEVVLEGVAGVGCDLALGVFGLAGEGSDTVEDEVDGVAELGVLLVEPGLFVGVDEGHVQLLGWLVWWRASIRVSRAVVGL
jgi:hypothetical protein